MPHENASPQKMAAVRLCLSWSVDRIDRFKPSWQLPGRDAAAYWMPRLGGHDACNKKAGVAAGFHCYISIAKN
jgi:hypothetical protein